jgi:hypothetical protein
MTTNECVLDSAKDVPLVGLRACRQCTVEEMASQLTVQERNKYGDAEPDALPLALKAKIEAITGAGLHEKRTDNLTLWVDLSSACPPAIDRHPRFPIGPPGRDSRGLAGRGGNIMPVHDRAWAGPDWIGSQPALADSGSQTKPFHEGNKGPPLLQRR